MYQKNNPKMLSDDIEQLNIILDRTIGFISNCDTKVSFILTSLGVILTILATINAPNLAFIQNQIKQVECNYLFLFGIFVFLVSTICFVIGLYHLAHVLIARVNIPNKLKSKIFFGDISQYADYKNYTSEIFLMSETEYKEDIISQIYVNSKICMDKYKYYNIGFRFSLYSLPCFIFSWCYIFQK